MGKNFEEEITTLQINAYITRGYLTILLKKAIHTCK